MSETETLEKQAADVQAPDKTAEAATKQLDAAEEQAGYNSIFEDKKHFPIFPTNLFEFGVKEPDVEKLNNCLPAINELGNPDLPNWSTPPNLNQVKEFGEITPILNEAIYEALRFNAVNYDNLLITSLRAYRFSEPAVAPLEVRPNNLLAGLLVLKGGGGKDSRVTFFDPRPQAWVIKPPISQASIFNSDAFSVDMKRNKIYMFPAWLQYQVIFGEDMEESIYLTWTAMVKGGGVKKPQDP